MSELLEEESNFLTFYFLNLKIASKAVLVYFDSVHPPATLVNELKQSYGTLKRLRHITQKQLQILYPPSGGTVKSKVFDTTLVVCLLRNMTPRESGPIFGWDDLPSPVDKSTGADLARIKWYRNFVAHHGDGKLSATDFNCYWKDLENAIGRLGGSSMLIEAQSAQRVVLDKSVTDMLIMLRSCEKKFNAVQKTQVSHSTMISNLQSAIDNQITFIKKHREKIELLNSPNGDDENHKAASDILDHKESISKCMDKIQACEKEVKDMEEKVIDKQTQVTDFNRQLAELECKFQEINERLVEQDVNMAKYIKVIDDMERKQLDIDATSGQSKKQRLEDDVKTLIEVDEKEGTFVTTKAAEDGVSQLKRDGVVLISGQAGTGKSRIGRHILHAFCTEEPLYKCIKLNTVDDWNDMVSRKDNVVVLIDDIFGETNCIYNSENDVPILDTIHAYVCKGNIKVIITIRDTVKRQCQEVFDSHRLFQFYSIDLSSDNYELSLKEKETILTVYMQKIRKSDYVKDKGFVDIDGVTILSRGEVFKIECENPVKGFPLVVYQFVHNDKYFKLGSTYFDRPTDAMIEEIKAIRQKGEDDRKIMIKYAVMVYTALNGNCINPDENSMVTKIAKIIDVTYGETIILKKCQLSDAVKMLQGSYLVYSQIQRSYRFHHPTLLEGVILSFAHIDEDNLKKILPLISWSFFLKMIKSESYKEKEGEVVLRIPTSSYNMLGSRLASIFKHNFRKQSPHLCEFVRDLSLLEIFKHENCFLLTFILKALEMEDNEDKQSELLTNMVRTNESNSDYNYSTYLHLKDNVFFLAFLIVNEAKKKKQIKMYNCILPIVKQLITTSNNEYFLTNYVKVALIQSFYEICATKDVRSVKDTLNLVEEIKITVLLDQGINFTKLSFPDIKFWRNLNESDNTCIFLTLCISKAYEAFNVPVLEYLLSKYNDTFDVNLFLRMFYSKDWMKQNVRRGESSLLSHEPIKWMINKFKKAHNVVDIEFVLGAACKYQLRDAVEYLTSIRKTFGAISCLKFFLGLDKYKKYIDLESSDKELFHFLFSKIEGSSSELTSIVISLLKKTRVPDYIIDAFLPVCLNNEKLLTLACTNAHLYVVKLVLENSQNVDIQSALISACIRSESSSHTNITVEKLEVVKYIVNTFEHTKLDLKAACQQAYHSKLLHIIEWFVQNIDLYMLDVDFVIKSECVKIQKYKSTKFSKRTSNILEILWNGLQNKEEPKMMEIVETAYENKCFELLIWVHENCKPQIAIDANKLLMISFENDRVDVVEWILQNFELTSEDIAGKVKEILDTAYQNKCLKLLMWTHINGFSYISFDAGKLFMLACDRNSGCEWLKNESIHMVNWVIENFKISPLDLKLGVLKMFSCGMSDIREMTDNLFSLLVSLLEKCFSCLCSDDMDEIMNEPLKLKWYFLLDWFLENRCYYTMNKQKILNEACKDGQIKTIKLLKDDFHSLDMNEAFLQACIHINIPLFYMVTGLFGDDTFNDDVQCVACLDLLWKYNQRSIDINRIVHTVCMAKYVKNRVMTWILQNLPYEQIPIQEVLVSCCQQNKINHVKYIFHNVDFKHTDIRVALDKTCLAEKQDRTHNVHHNLVDYLLTKVNVEDVYLCQNFEALLRNGKLNLVLYLLHREQSRNIPMNLLLGFACVVGNTKLVQWLLKNVKYKRLDTKKAFAAMCQTGKLNYEQKLRCVALMWYYVRDTSIFEIGTISKEITQNMSKSNKEDWIRYINHICFNLD